jgi:hypothetical protein
MQFQFFQNWSQLQKVSKTNNTTSVLIMMSKHLDGQDKMLDVEEHGRAFCKFLHLTHEGSHLENP